jgi:hypothetical protein
VLPPQILVVLRGNPLADERGSVSVEASFRPGLDQDALLHCGLWARAHGQAYGIGIRSGGDHDADGTLWHWDGYEAVHVLLGRRQDIYGR